MWYTAYKNVSNTPAGPAASSTPGGGAASTSASGPKAPTFGNRSDTSRSRDTHPRSGDRNNV